MYSLCETYWNALIHYFNWIETTALYLLRIYYDSRCVLCIRDENVSQGATFCLILTHILWRIVRMIYLQY